MALDLNRILKRRTRGLLLKALEMLCFDELSLASMAGALMEWHCPASDVEIQTELKYLAEKGYVELANDGKAAVITAKGVDLLEGSIEPDPGVMLDAEDL